MAVKESSWSELPKDLLRSIGKRLEDQIHVLRFRSVCVSWRSSIPARCPPLPLRLPLPTSPNHNNIHLPGSSFSLTSITVYRLEPLQNPSPPPKTWLIKAGETHHQGNMVLLNPFTPPEIGRLPPTFPRPLNLSNFRISQICHSYSHGAVPNHVKKAALFCDPSNDLVVVVVIHKHGDSFVKHNCGALAATRLGDQEWRPLASSRGHLYCDITKFKGKIYAVDEWGSCVVVDSSLSATEIAHPWNRLRGRKHLVESLGELMLVNVEFHALIHTLARHDEETGILISESATEDRLCLKVYKLNEEEHKWDEVSGLGDRMLFLGADCSFSVSAKDFDGCKGNCIVFMDKYGMFCEGGYHQDEYDHAPKRHPYKSRPGIFNLDDGSDGPLVWYPGYTDIFWPPPSWLVPCSSSSSQS